MTNNPNSLLIRFTAINAGILSGFGVLVLTGLFLSALGTYLPDKAFELVKSYWIRIPIAVISLGVAINCGLTVYEIIYLPSPRRVYHRLIGMIAASGLVTSCFPLILVYVSAEQFKLSFDQAANQSSIIFVGTFVALIVLSRRYEEVAKFEQVADKPLK